MEPPSQQYDFTGVSSASGLPKNKIDESIKLPMTVVFLSKADADLLRGLDKWRVRKLCEVVMRRGETQCLLVAITEDKIQEPESEPVSRFLSETLESAV